MSKLGVVVPSCNPTLWRWRHDWKFGAALGYIVRPCLKTTKYKQKQSKQTKDKRKHIFIYKYP
jgi:hypothetical protein